MLSHVLRRRALALAACLAAAPAPCFAWTWDGAAWADYRAYLSPIDASEKARLREIVSAGAASGRVLGRMGQIGDSITESSAYFRNAILSGPSSNETGHDYDAIRSWLAYSSTQPADGNSFYDMYGKGIEYGCYSGWTIPIAVSVGHPATGVLTGDGTTPGEYSWALLMFGTNDIDSFWDPVAWKAMYRTFIQGYIDLGVVPVLSTIPPEQAHVGDSHVEQANAVVVQLAAELQIPWVDYYGLILHFQPVDWHGTLIGSDGTHPTAATGGRGFSQVAQTSTDGYALRTKLTFDMAEKLRAIVFDNGAPDGPPTGVPPTNHIVTADLEIHPNPFRTMTWLRAPLGTSPAGQLRIVDATGRVLKHFVDLGEARRNVDRAWDGRDDVGRSVPSGVYFAVWGVGRQTRAARVVLLR